MPAPISQATSRAIRRCRNSSPAFVAIRDWRRSPWRQRTVPLAGATVVIAERSLDAKGNHRGFIIDGSSPGEFRIRRSEDFDVSDANFLPNGDLLILERRFSFSGGFAMRIREIAAASIKPGALLDGTTLITADNTFQIDNMEGLAVRTTASGETLLDIISDDNHGFLQRSVLLQFKLVPPAAPTP